MPTPDVYQFGSCNVDLSRRQISLGGVISEPQPKVFDLLVYLIERRDRVVDKDELLQQLWPGVVVTDSALAQCLKKARAMVGDDGDRQAVIQTVQRRGFRFIANLEGNPEAFLAEAPRPETSTQSIAVLPFADLSQQGSYEHFADGMADTIINELAQFTTLRIAARSSAFALKGRAVDARQVGTMLGVSTVLEGSVQLSGSSLRVTAQLVDTANGFQIWSRRWDKDVEDIFSIQDEIARRISETFHMGSSLARPALPGSRTMRISAYDLHLRGLSYLHRGTCRSQRFAIDMFTQALDIDPRFARAWAGLAASHILLTRFSAQPEHHQREALLAANMAVEIDPVSAQAWIAKGGAAMVAGDLKAAEAALEHAITLAPRLFEAHFYFGHLCLQAGMAQKAAASLERALRLHPDDYQALALSSRSLSLAGDQQRAAQARDRALAALARALTLDPSDASLLSASASLLVETDRGAEARGNLNRALTLEPDEPSIQYQTACGFCALGDLDQAVRCLERVVAIVSRCPEWLGQDKALDPLRGHAGFRALLSGSAA